MDVKWVQEFIVSHFDYEKRLLQVAKITKDKKSEKELDLFFTKNSGREEAKRTVNKGHRFALFDSGNKVVCSHENLSNLCQAKKVLVDHYREDNYALFIYDSENAVWWGRRTSYGKESGKWHLWTFTQPQNFGRDDE